MAKVLKLPVHLRKMTLGQLSDEMQSVAREVNKFYVGVGHLLRKLEAKKLRWGICTCGISCMKLAVGGSKEMKGKTLWCADHDPKKAAKRPARVHAYVTPYGLMRLAERIKEREAVEKSKKRNAKKATRGAA